MNWFSNLSVTWNIFLQAWDSYLSLCCTTCCLYMIWYDICVYMYVCLCVPFGHRSRVVQRQCSAPDWIKVLLGCGCAPFGKSGFGFAIEAQGEVLCYPPRGTGWVIQLKDEEEQEGRRDGGSERRSKTGKRIVEGSWWWCNKMFIYHTSSSNMAVFLLCISLPLRFE